MTYRLVLLRHGESEWNKANLFTGWYDADLTEAGENEAVEGGRLLADREILPDIVHTSVQTRAIRTANLTLDVIGRLWIPVRRSWRLNERHYGDLQGKNKAETAEQYGLEQVQIWRRAYATPPPPLDPTDERSARHDPRYALLPPELVPSTECLRDVLERMLPYWFDSIVPDLQTGATVMVAAHGNSLRALVKHLDGISDEAITSLNIPTGQPLVYELDARLRPIEDKPVDQRYLLSADEIQERAEAVAKQAGG